jgi:subtilisin family serine protease
MLHKLPFRPHLYRVFAGCALLALMPSAALAQALFRPAVLPAQVQDQSAQGEHPGFRAVGEDREGFVHLLLEADPAALDQAVRAAGGEVKYALGSYCAVRVPADRWRQLLSHPALRTFGGTGTQVLPLGDIMLSHSRVDSVYAGYAPLPQGYDGDGVVVGLIDLGIDYTHPDFRDENDRTRIRYIWDQNLPADGSAPLPYGYGQACDSASIEAGLCNHIDPNLSYSHGSGVSGVAAGNGRATGDFRGVAPRADIIAVNLAFNNTFLSNVVDAVRFIFDHAEAMGKPCVINTSLGTYLGSRDGRDLASLMIDAMLEERAGRALVAAAGNAGDRIYHLGYETGSDTSLTWFRYEAGLGAAYLQAWIDTTQASDWHFSVGADQPAGWSFRGRGPFWNLMQDVDWTSGPDSLEHELFAGPNRLGRIKCWVQRQGPSLLLEVAVFPDSTSLRWRLETTGSGRFDVWSDPSVTGTSYLFRGADLPSASLVPAMSRYRQPDALSTLVSSWQCSPRVITVGSYYNRNSMANFYGLNPPISGTPETRVPSSSSGPTRDGRIKPDVTASGQWILAPASTAMRTWLIGLGAANYIDQGGMHYLQGGTSFSSPVVAGIAALYLQRYPNADWRAVKNALLSGARQDAFTGSELPDNQWGYGKVNAFASMQISDEPCPTPLNPSLTHSLDSMARITWDPVLQAMGYQLRGRSIGAVRWHNYRSIDNVHHLHQLEPGADYQWRVRALCGVVDTSAWSVMHVFTHPSLRSAGIRPSFTLGPNPVHQQAVLHYSGYTGDELNFKVFDLPGRLVSQLTLDPAAHYAEWSRAELPAGLYLYQVTQSGSLLHQGRLLLP